MTKIPTARLDRLLANLGYGSRREVQLLVSQGLVQLDGTALFDAEQRLYLTPDLTHRLKVRGKALDPPPGMAVMMHKPLGVTCSQKDGGPLVYDLLPLQWRRRDPALSTIGRLDKDTSGLLVFTDDGKLLHRVISPRSHIEKRYHVTLERPLEGSEVERFASGTMVLESDVKPLLPATLVPLSPTTAWLTLREGRYHQVRRMFAAAGNHVAALHRDRLGGLALPSDLEPGAHQVLTAEAIESIFLKTELGS